MSGRTVTVLAGGPLTTVQDSGRPGLGHLGIGPSGAADLPALRRANLLVGNDSGAAALELTFGGLRLRFDDDALVALTGAPCTLTTSTADVTAGRRAVEMNVSIDVPAGAQLRIGTPRTGVRTYLAVAGGIATPPVLGSRSTDTLSGLGSLPLVAGVTLPLGPIAGPPRTPLDRPAEPVGQTRLTLVPGPRDDWFTAAAAAQLYGSTWSVTPEADRVGIRLTGPVLQRQIRTELPSEGMVAGAVQVPPSGLPIIFLADHPVTGGYPVIGVVAAADLPLAAQLRPGQRLTFRRR